MTTVEIELNLIEALTDLAVEKHSIKELAIGFVRYEAARRMNPQAFNDIYAASLSGKPFDELVDESIGLWLNRPREDKIEIPEEETVKDRILQENEAALLMDGFDDCIVGIVYRASSSPIACYSIDKVKKSLVKGGMTEEEAEEHIEYNQMGAWMGEDTPCFIKAL